jgi:hypothetical protein
MVDTLNADTSCSSKTIKAHRPFKHRRSSAPTGPLTNLVERHRLARRANDRLRARPGGGLGNLRGCLVGDGRVSEAG